MHRYKLYVDACSGDKKFELITIKIYVPIYFNFKNKYTIKKNITKKKEFLKNKLYY